ncbi:uncharacterized protein PpBr36_05587 [Pyricularia pennisetigena]|uniref:uncharacterized protein n=1 Tax=Pyricularia pennisetigena TaxID=1578925 RepID=UPI00114E96D0|nr:uncharacterized protein PpBr36_05587 [Pyricularia pennisetigena]TLS23098.1 hypothetical protein PpBr36_05587 [Pyricularia pennisetigena]
MHHVYYAPERAPLDTLVHNHTPGVPAESVQGSLGAHTPHGQEVYHVGGGPQQSRGSEQPDQIRDKEGPRPRITGTDSLAVANLYPDAAAHGSHDALGAKIEAQVGGQVEGEDTGLCEVDAGVVECGLVRGADGKYVKGGGDGVEPVVVAWVGILDSCAAEHGRKGLGLGYQREWVGYGRRDGELVDCVVDGDDVEAEDGCLAECNFQSRCSRGR